MPDNISFLCCQSRALNTLRKVSAAYFPLHNITINENRFKKLP